MMAKLLARVGGAGGGQPQQPAGKRQRRADVLSGLDDDGFGVRKPGKAAQAPSASSKPAAAKKDEEAMKAWLAEEDSAAAAASSGAAAPASAPPAEEPAASAAAETAAAGAEEPAAQEEAPAAAVAGGESKEASPKAAKEAKEATGAPAKIGAASMAGNGWQARFVDAKDSWYVDKESRRGRLWHSESGCCFEWDQVSGTLYQYILEERGERAAGEPDLCPIWSMSCPDRHAWVWESLPMPPRAEGSSKEDEEPAPAEEVPEPEGAAPEQPSSGSSSSMPPPAMPPPAMPPPSMPFKKKPQPPKASEGQGGAGAAEEQVAAVGPQLPSSEEERKGGAAAAPSKAPRAEEEEEDCMQLPLGGALEDDDGPVEPLAAGEAVSLPPAPPKAKPQACDADLDMFGEPEENAAEALD